MLRRAKRLHNFTEPYLKRLKPEAERYEVYDTDRPRLLIRVTPKGTKTFGLSYRSKSGKMERVTYGKFPGIALKDARDLARVDMGKVGGGASPASARRGLRRDETLGDLWEKFLKLHAKPRKRSWRTDEKRWEFHLAVHAGERLGGITTAMVTRWLSKITATSGAGAANRVRALLHTMFEKGRKQWGLTVPNPVGDTARHPEKSKERYLLPDELRRFVAALDADKDPDTRDFCKLSLWTGQRRGTVCAMRWADVNLDDAAWSIPASDMKAGKPLLVPLATAVVEILKARLADTPEGQVYVFPANRPSGHTEGPRAGWTRVLKAAAIESMTVHDLRRSFAVWAQDAGAGLEVIASLLGHTPAGGVTSVYARVPFDTKRRWVEAAVRNMQAIITAPQDGTLLHFPGGVAVGGGQ